MSETFRPSTLGEILDRTAQIYRRNFWLFAGVAALPIGAIFALTAIGGALFGAATVAFRASNLANPAAIALVVLIVLIAAPVYIAAAVFSSAGLTEAAASTSRDEKITIRGAFKKVTPRFWRYLWLIILQGIVVGLIPAAIAGAVIGVLLFVGTLAGAGTSTAIAVGFLVFIVVVAAVVVIIELVLGYSISLPVCVLEKKPAWDSLKRGWSLSKGTRGRIFVMFLLVMALAMAVSMISAIPSMIIIFTSAAGGSQPATGSVAFIVAEITRAVLDLVLQVALAPISAIALVLFYYDQRIRKEGFDIEWMMQQAGLTPTASQAPTAPALGISGPVAPPDTVEEP
ncbi:MAG: glycerophosphoryl diester phosphodiesterase membrane domain-containing protein [Terracidiphilus sp.]